MKTAFPASLENRLPKTPAVQGDDALGRESSTLVVITGGSKGIGKACVESFAQRGAHVLFTYRSDIASAKRLESKFQPAGRVQGRWLDQGDFESVCSFAEEVEIWREGRVLDVVVNNAALGVATVSNYASMKPNPQSNNYSADESSKGHNSSSKSSVKTTVAGDIRRRAEEDVALMRVNALGPMWVTEALLPMMQPHAKARSVAAEKGLAQDGAKEIVPLNTQGPKRVLFIGSVGGGSQSVFPGFRAADAMSKAALAYACKHFAARSVDNPCFRSRGGEGSEKDIPEGKMTRVDFMCLCPGATLTDMFRSSTLDKMAPAERERFESALPQGRLILPEEVGEAVYWLCCSSAASMFNGAVIDGSAGLAVRPGALTEF